MQTRLGHPRKHGRHGACVGGSDSGCITQTITLLNKFPVVECHPGLAVWRLKRKCAQRQLESQARIQRYQRLLQRRRRC